MSLTEADRRRVRGHLVNVSPAAFVQMIAIERETCALVVREDGRHGVLHFLGGDLLDARLGEVHGEEAALQILGWQLAEVETQVLDETPSRTINAPLTFILLEAMRRRDEGLGLEELPPVADPGTPGISAAEMLVEAFVRELDGLSGACLIDVAAGLSVAERFTSTAGYDTTRVSDACIELGRAEVTLAAKLSPRSTLTEIALTFDDMLVLLRFLPSNLALVLLADPGRLGLSSLHAALRRLAPSQDPGFGPWQD